MEGDQQAMPPSTTVHSPGAPGNNTASMAALPVRVKKPRGRFVVYYLLFGLVCQLVAIGLGYWSFGQGSPVGLMRGYGILAELTLLATLAWLTLGAGLWLALWAYRNRGQYTLRFKLTLVTLLCVLLSTVGVAVKRTVQRVAARMPLLAKVEGDGFVYREYPYWRTGIDAVFFRNEQGNAWLLPQTLVEALDVWTPPKVNIDARSPELTDADVVALAREFPRLESLSLPQQIRGDLIFPRFPVLRELKHLDLGFGKTQNFDPELLTKFPKLETCNLELTEIDFAFFRRLKERYPHVSFDSDAGSLQTEESYDACLQIRRKTRAVVYASSYKQGSAPASGRLHVCMPTDRPLDEAEFQVLMTQLRRVLTSQPRFEWYSLQGREWNSPRLTDGQLTQLMQTFPGWIYVQLGIGITDQGFASLGQAKGLRDIVAQSSAITTAGLASLRGHPALRRIYLPSSSVDDAALEVLETLPHLDQANFSGSKMTPAGEGKLKELIEGNKKRAEEKAAEEKEESPTTTGEP